MTLVGRTALSVEISTTRSTPTARAHSATTPVPKVLFRSPPIGFCSTIGTCL